MQIKITLDTSISVLNRFEFDQSMLILINHDKEITVSEKFSKNLIIQ
jgi:hypothetical protein